MNKVTSDQLPESNTVRRPNETRVSLQLFTPLCASQLFERVGCLSGLRWKRWFRACTLKRFAGLSSRWFRSPERDNIVCRSEYLPRGPGVRARSTVVRVLLAHHQRRTFRNTGTCFIRGCHSLVCSSFSRRAIILTPSPLLSTKLKILRTIPARSTFFVCF